MTLGIAQALPKRSPSDNACCKKITIEEKLGDGEVPIADENIVGDYIIAGGDSNGYNIYHSLDNKMAIWHIADFGGSGPVWMIGSPKNVGKTQNYAYGPSSSR